MKSLQIFLFLILSSSLFILHPQANLSPSSILTDSDTNVVGYYLFDEKYIGGKYSYDWQGVPINSGIFLYENEGINYDFQIAYFSHRIVTYITIYDDVRSSVINATNATAGEEFYITFAQGAVGFVDDYSIVIGLGNFSSYVAGGSYINNTFQYSPTPSLALTTQYENAAWHIQLRIDITQSDIPVSFTQSLQIALSYVNYRADTLIGHDSGFDSKILSDYLLTADFSVTTTVSFVDPLPTFYADRIGTSNLYAGYYGQILLKVRINLFVSIYDVEFVEHSPLPISAITGTSGASPTIIRSASEAKIKFNLLTSTVDMVFEYWINIPEDQSPDTVIWPAVNISYKDIYLNEHVTTILPAQNVQVYADEASTNQANVNATAKQDTIDFSAQGPTAFDTFVFGTKLIIGLFIIILGIYSLAVSRKFSAKINNFQQEAEQLILNIARQSQHPNKETVESFLRRALLDVSVLVAELRLLDKTRSVATTDIIFAKGKLQQALYERVTIYFKSLPTYSTLLELIFFY